MSAEVRIASAWNAREIASWTRRGSSWVPRTMPCVQRGTQEMLTRAGERVDQLGKLLESYSFHSVLNRGFALVRDQDGQPVLSAMGVGASDMIGIEFGDGEIRARVSDGTTGIRPAVPRKREPDRGSGGNQGSLL